MKDAGSFLSDRIFRGLLLDADIARMTEEGLLEPTSEAGLPPLLGELNDFFPRRLSSRAEGMAYAYALSFCFENSVRELVAQRMEEQLGADWWEKVPDKVKKRVEDRRSDAEKNRWHMAAVESNIGYSLFGDLASIIVTHWREFEEMFPSQEWVKHRLDELERSRNVIAHANNLNASEIERIEQYLRDWLRQVP